MSERDIFLAAREHHDLSARAAFLDKACANDVVLRQRIERLLRADAGADRIFEKPAALRPVSDLGIVLDENPLPDNAPEKRSEETLHFLEPPGRADALGRIGHYEVLGVLSQGGFGIVFRAFDVVLQRVVAVKVLAPPLAVTSPARKRFLREARSSAAIRHENIVQVYAVEELPLPEWHCRVG